MFPSSAPCTSRKAKPCAAWKKRSRICIITMNWIRTCLTVHTLETRFASCRVPEFWNLGGNYGKWSFGDTLASACTVQIHHSFPFSFFRCLSAVALQGFVGTSENVTITRSFFTGLLCTSSAHVLNDISQKLLKFTKMRAFGNSFDVRGRVELLLSDKAQSQWKSVPV